MRNVDSRARMVRWLPAAVWMLVIFGFSSLRGSSLPGTPDYLSQVAHFTEYAILGALLVFATAPRKLTVRLALVLLLAASLYGVTDELHQAFVPGRMPDPVDWMIDTAGTGLAIAGIAVIRRCHASR